MAAPITDYLNRAAMAERESWRVDRLSEQLNVSDDRMKVTRGYLTQQYLRLLDQAFSAKNLQVAHKVLESLERLHFGKVSKEPETTSRKAKPTRKPIDMDKLMAIARGEYFGEKE